MCCDPISLFAVGGGGLGGEGMFGEGRESHLFDVFMVGGLGREKGSS